MLTLSPGLNSDRVSGMSHEGFPYSEEQIVSCARVLAHALNPDEVWLFGSAARGDGDQDSDVDLLVVLADGHGRERPMYDANLALIRSRIGIPTEVLVITQSGKRNPSPIVEDALREGRRLL